MFLRKITVFVLIAAMLDMACGSTALADPTTDGILIKKGENNDNVILLQLRLRDLGFYNYKVTGFFGDFTSQALMDFQKENNLTADGVAGERTLALMYSNQAKRKDVKPFQPPKTTTTTKKKTYGAMVDWSKINKLWKIGMRCKVIDLDSGITYYMIRCNRSYSVPHADVAPATKSDFEKMKKTYGGDLNAYRRALVVLIGGQAYAASLYAEPHGSTGVKGNGMNKADGTLQQVCIHFLNSRNNIHNMIDPSHQYQVKRAANKKPGIKPPPLVYPGD